MKKIEKLLPLLVACAMSQQVAASGGDENESETSSEQVIADSQESVTANIADSKVELPDASEPPVVQPVLN